MSDPGSGAGTIALTPVERPNGKIYRPRKITCEAVTGEFGEVCAVIVFGTHDAASAGQFAAESARYWEGSQVDVFCPLTGWWRDAMYQGSRTWSIDAVRGRAGVWFDVKDPWL